MSKNKLPTYQQLFGQLNFKQGEDARSVYSPAAYLADLLQLIEDYFDTEDQDWKDNGFFAKTRREDIRGITLDKDHTYSTRPYLDIVNSMLEKQLGEKPYAEVLKSNRYPLNLPFNFDFQQAAHYLKQLEVSWTELLKAFSTQTAYQATYTTQGIENAEGLLQKEGLYQGTEYMGWSDESYASFYAEQDEAAFLKAYGVAQKYHLAPHYKAEEPDGRTPLEALQYLEIFLHCTGISEQELREIVYQNLSLRKDSEEQNEGPQAAQFWINKGSDGRYVVIEENELTGNRLICNDGSAVPFKWFQKVDRLIRVQRKSAISYAELDQILRMLPPLLPLDKALLFIPLIKEVSNRTGLTITEVLVFAAQINTIGVGDGPEPMDQLNSVFNPKTSKLYPRYLTISADHFVPLQFKGFSPLFKTEDLNLNSSEEAKNHILHALRLKETDFELILTKMRDPQLLALVGNERALFKKGTDLQSLTTLYRIKLLTKVCECSVTDLFTLFDLIANDPTIRNHNYFDIYALTEAKSGEDYYKFKSPYWIIFDTDLFENLWLLQTCFALSSWMSANELTAKELEFWASGVEKEEKEAEKIEREKLSFLNKLLAAYQPYFLSSQWFNTTTFNQRDAQLILETVQDAAYQLVAEKDERLVLQSQDQAKDAAHAAIIDLEIINEQDFMGLNLAEKMANKIVKNLILLGYLDESNNIIEANLPTAADEFIVDFDFSAYRETVFYILHELTLERMLALSEQEVDFDLALVSEIEVWVFKTHFEALELEDAWLQALYDNLIFNQVLTEDGMIYNPLAFAFEDGLDTFAINIDLAPYAEKIHERLVAHIQDFNNESLIISAEVFADTGLAAHEVQDLLANLVFNDYLTEKHRVVDKNALLALAPNKFLLALLFYPKRKAILKALQDHISEFKETHFAVDGTVIHEVADEIVAKRAFAALSDTYFPEGPVEMEYQGFFLDEANKVEFYVDSYFDFAATDIIFDTIGRIISSSNRFLFNHLILEDLNFSYEEMIQLKALLMKNRLITHYNAIHEDQLGFFLNINNLVGFSLAGFEDYNEDIFIALHLCAKATDEAVNEITATLKTIAKSQGEALFFLFQEQFGLSADLIEFLFKRLYAEDDNLAHQILLPLIASVSEKEGEITEVTDSQFNLAYQRMRQLVSLFSKLELDTRAAKVIVDDQDLVQKFPEKFELPAGKIRFDAVLETQEDTFLVFFGGQYATYSALDYQLQEGGLQALSKLSKLLDDTQSVNAAYRDEAGNEWIVQGDKSIMRKLADKEQDEEWADKWEVQEKEWGLIENEFSKPDMVDFTFVDEQGRVYIFTGNQYARYTNGLPQMDPGYPKTILDNWEQENIKERLPIHVLGGQGTSIMAKNGKRYVFDKDSYSCSDNYQQYFDLNSFWGKVKSNFTALETVDAAYFKDGQAVIIRGDQAITYSNNIESEGILIDEGSPISLNDLQDDLLETLGGELRAVFTDRYGRTHYFGKEKYLTLDPASEAGEAIEIKEVWGKNDNNLSKEGAAVDAALDGLDGNIYLFSGLQYYRYEREDYSKVDEGYPRLIKADWGGLDTVDAATTLDGKTYLFGQKDGKATHIRFSTNDYNSPDEDYHQEEVENWWNLPFALVEQGFAAPDAVFQDFQGDTHLFYEDQFVSFDRLQRWWSEPSSISDRWAGLPFTKVDAAFIGKDGRTYLFSGGEFVRYTDKLYHKLDEDYPKKTADYFGKIDNLIAEGAPIDAAVALISRTTDEDEVVTSHHHAYLFAGPQYVRYTLTTDDPQQFPTTVDMGYPKLIARDLVEEPRFKGLELDPDRPLAAVMADQRTVYVFQGANVHAYSDALARTYKLQNEEGDAIKPQAIVQEDGRTFFLEDKRWQWLGALEHAKVNTKLSIPNTLSQVPDQYFEDLESVLQGTDGNTYLFGASKCYNVALEKDYPTKDAWGIANNNFLLDNNVDSGFLGLDDKLYLFSDDQFVSYTISADKKIPAEADANPESIAASWGGLSHVFLAYVDQGKTYLMEYPDEAGVFRYVRYSSDDYSEPDEGFPQLADFSFWGIPQEIVDQGFMQVTAIHVEDDNFYIFYGNTFIQYNGSTQQWTSPMPVERVWPEVPIGEVNLVGETNKESFVFQDVMSLLSGPDGELIFFSTGTYTVHKGGQFSGIQSIKSRWGIVHSEFIGEESTVDACFVSASGQTFLFAGTNYIRYSTSDYRIVDAGYPKAIGEHLKEEEGFAHLPEDFTETFDKHAKIDAIMRYGRHHVLFMDDQALVISATEQALLPVEQLGYMRNNIQSDNWVDTAYVNAKGDLILFSGDQYYRYSDKSLTYVDEGYPKSLRENFEREEGFKLPKDFEQGIDGAAISNGKLVLFHEDQAATADGDGTAVDLEQVLGSKDKAFGQTTATGVDAAFLAPDGYFYVFKGEHYIRYEDSDSEFVEEGYPRPIRDNWGNMATTFERGIDAAFVQDGVTYFLKGEEYIRYSDAGYQQMDPIYPQQIRDRFGKWNDIQLGDIKIATQFKMLLQQAGSKADSLLDFFDPMAPDRNDSFELLGQIFGWMVDEIKWLKRKHGFLPKVSRFERNLDLELVLRMHQIFSLSKRLNRKPSAIYEKLWMPLYQATDAPARSFKEVAITLSEILSSKRNKSDWAQLQLDIHDHFNLLKRDAMLPYVIANDPEVENARDLLGKLLVDVEMGAEAKTSPIKEAIAAAQLFWHRYFVQIEDFKIKDDDKETAKAELREQWRWLKNYRVWEANRKVYLYPENYVRPELRDLRTPAFDTLTNELLQGDMNDATISQIYKKYLDEYTEVSRLTIAGGFVYDDPEDNDDKELILFGRTKTDPRRYYYRNATFFEEDGSALWYPWEEIKIKIDADKVYPVYAFGRVFVFWWVLEKEAVEPEKGSVELSQTSSSTHNAQSSGKNIRSVVNIYFSFYNLNKEWSTPQLLDRKIVESRNLSHTDTITRQEYIDNLGNKSGIKYHKKSSETNIHSDSISLFIQKQEEVKGQVNESILIQCMYDVSREDKYVSEEFYFTYYRKFYFAKNNHIVIPYKHEKMVLDYQAKYIDRKNYRSFVLWPELYTDKVNISAPQERTNGWYNKIFAEGVHSTKRTVHLNKVNSAPNDLWVSYDHKGGSFLIRSKKKGTELNVKLPSVNNLLRQSNINNIDAAFHFGNANHYFAADQYFSAKKNLENKAGVPISTVWGKYGSKFSPSQQIAAAWLQDGKAYLVANGKRYGYTVNTYGQAFVSEEGYSAATGLMAAYYHAAKQQLYHFYNDVYTVNGSSRGLRSIKESWGFRYERTGKAGWSLQYGGKTLLFLGGIYGDQRPDAYRYLSLDNDQIGNSTSISLLIPTLESIATQLEVSNLTEFIKSATFKLSSKRKMPAAKQRIVVGGYINHKQEGILLVEGVDIHHLIRVEQLEGATVLVDVGETDTPPKYRFAYVHQGETIGFSPEGEILLDGTVVKSELTNVPGGIIKDSIKQQYLVLSGLNYEVLPVLLPESANGLIERLAAIDWSVAPMISDMGEALNVTNWRDSSGFSDTKIHSTISRTGQVDAAWHKEGKLYLTKGDEYVRYSTDDYSQIDLGYPKKLKGNTEGLATFNIGAAFAGEDGFVYYFDNAKSEWVNSISLTTNGRKIREWGYVFGLKDIDFTKVDAAYSVDKVVYLFAGSNMYRHTTVDGKTFALDHAAPLALPVNVGAACILDQYVYFFERGNFKKLSKKRVPVADDFKDGWTDIYSGLKNIHEDFESGFDAALNDQANQTIYLFKGIKEIVFEDNEESANPKIEERPPGELYYEVVRLTSGTGKILNTALFGGGIDALLSLEIQSADESPRFVRLEAEKPRPVEKQDQILIQSGTEEIVNLPISSHLDFHSANGMYYWEIFYHIPLLIAQTYNNLQKFDEAKRWYEFVYNPMQIGEYWRFMPFLNVDVGAIIDSIESSVQQLDEAKAENLVEVKTALGVDGDSNGLLGRLKHLDRAVIAEMLDNEIMEQVFKAGANTTDGFFDNLEDKLRTKLYLLSDDKEVIRREKEQLLELSYVLEKLQARILNLTSRQAELRAYRNDPFDPHAIAQLRKEAYRKAVVMTYVDNLLDWGDMLFRQYTVESINEARMHYILAYDLLGQKPENVGQLLLPENKAFTNLNHEGDTYGFKMTTGGQDYFHIPENTNFLDYWERVEDRLYKIRMSLNILGIKQELPLFQPPIDPMALVNAVAGGGGLAAALAGLNVKIPHYRFTFMIEQAKQLAEKVNQFGNDLLSNLEKKDQEELSLMQTRQEGEILGMTIKVNQAQIEEADFNIKAAEESVVEAVARMEHYDNLLEDGLLTHEEAQIGLMIATNVLNTASGILKIGSALAYAFPKVDVGPFKFGIQVGGDMVANGLDKISEAVQGVAQVTSLTGEIIGVYANHERQKEDWRLQKRTAQSNIEQFKHQIEAAKLQRDMAQYQMDILQKQIDHNSQVADFYRNKFTSKQLYGWMVSQLSGIYYQTYKQAFDLAKVAEKAYQFERGVKETDATFISGGYWDSQRKGLLAGDKLMLDINRMERAFYESDHRTFEVKKEISLFALDPVALVKLKKNRVCEFSLTEALFNYDFQGHYRRQIKSIGLTFEAGEESLVNVNATLTQLTSKIIMEPDIKAVKYLMNPQGDMPASIRGNWRSSQQIVFSQGDQYSGVDNGLFELRYDDQRYLPFEGTGAVSDWRLELPGLREDYSRKEISDVIITVYYTAYQGGELFGGEVKSTLKPYLTAQMVNVAQDFPQDWNDFLASEEDELSITLLPSMFPRMRGSKIEGILCKYELYTPGTLGLMLKEQDGQLLSDGQLMATGLKLPKDGATWTFVLDGDKDNLKNAELIFTYKATLE